MSEMGFSKQASNVKLAKTGLVVLNNDATVH